MNLNELKILQIIRDYRQDAGSNRQALLRDFQRETDLYIYHFPKLGYRRGPDDCSEFYLYVMERMEPMLPGFPFHDAESGAVRFKTWFNAVLRNQFFNFLKYRKRGMPGEQCLDSADIENLAVMALPEQGDEVLEGLKRGLSRLDAETRGLLILYYIPESLDGETVKILSDRSGLSIAEILAVQKEMMSANEKEIGLKRAVADKISRVNHKLAGLRYRLHKIRRNHPGGAADEPETHSVLAGIARWENTRSRLVRSLDRPEGEAFDAFRKLFRDRVQAVRSLEQARKKLKWEILALTSRAAEVTG